MNSSAIYTNAEYNYVAKRINDYLRGIVEDAGAVNDITGTTPCAVRTMIVCSNAKSADEIKSKMYAMYNSCAIFGPGAQYSRHRLVLACITWDMLQYMKKQFTTEGATAEWFASTAKYNICEIEIAAMLAE